MDPEAAMAEIELFLTSPHSMVLDVGTVRLDLRHLSYEK